MGRNAKLNEKQMWSNKKLHFKNARKLQKIYFIGPEDKEFKENMKNARKKFETPIAPAMLCKTCKKSKNVETRGETNDFETKFACILEASESTTLRVWKNLYRNIMTTIPFGRK